MFAYPCCFTPFHRLLDIIRFVDMHIALANAIFSRPFSSAKSEWERERERGREKKLLFNSIHVHVLSSHSPLSMSLVNIFEFYLNILCVSIPICSERYWEQWLSKELISHSTCARVAHSFILWGANSLFASHQQFVIFFRKQYYAIAFGEQ